MIGEKLTDEDLDAVVGGSHISTSELGSQYIGKTLTYQWSTNGITLNHSRQVTINSITANSDGSKTVNVSLPVMGYVMESTHGANETQCADGTWNITYSGSTYNYLSVND